MTRQFLNFLIVILLLIMISIPRSSLLPQENGRRGQSWIFFEPLLAKKVRTDPAPAVTNP